MVQPTLSIPYWLHNMNHTDSGARSGLHPPSGEVELSRHGIRTMLLCVFGEE